MAKNPFLIGTILAGIMTSNNLSELARTDNYTNSKNKERVIQERIIEEYFPIITDQSKMLAREELFKRDKIYRTIVNFYRGMDISDYITKEFVRALIRIESTDNPRAVSHCGARGLGQIMKSAWYEVEKEDYWKNSFIPEKNIKVTIKYLASLDKYCKEYHPNWNYLEDSKKRRLLAAAYNCGPYALNKRGWNINKMPDETKEYIPKLEKALREIGF